MVGGKGFNVPRIHSRILSVLLLSATLRAGVFCGIDSATGISTTDPTRSKRGGFSILVLSCRILF